MRKDASATMPQNSQFMSVKDFSEVSGCSTKHVYNLCSRGEIKAVRLGNAWRINRKAAYELLGIEEGAVCC